MHDGVLAALSGQFRVERELGGGGMSRVYLAEETALGRRVVIKVLPPDLAHAVSVERFKREILVAAQLSHPHIVPVLSAGDVGGQPYYVMPYVDGESLRARLMRGTMSWQETVHVLRQIAAALAVAHARGVVHRDIKPENILISGDAIAITDFGLAKALAAATASGDGRAGLTETGIALGTPAYMAPEQAVADATADHRADVYAFGCVAYEMLSGTTPFHGRSMAQQLAAHVHETPRPLTAVTKDVPPGLSALVMRCLAKNVADRPANAAEISKALDGVALPVTLPKARTIAIAASVVAVIAAAAFLIPRVGSVTPAKSPYIAVAEFKNEGPDSAQYFVDGLGGAISERLAGISGLHVIDHQSAIAVSKTAATAKEIGEQLEADYVLRGTVRWDLASAAKRAQLSVSLVNVSDGTTKWTGNPITFTPSVDPFAVQQDVATSVAEALNIAISPADSSAIATRETNSAEAYLLFERGEQLYTRTVTAADMVRPPSTTSVRCVSIRPSCWLGRAGSKCA